MLSGNPEDFSMYMDATTAIPQGNLDNDNESLGSHSHPLDTQQAPNKTLQSKMANGDIIRSKHPPTENKDDRILPEPENAFGGCTPGLRRRRELTDKYVTEPSQVKTKLNVSVAKQWNQNPFTIVLYECTAQPQVPTASAS